MSCTSTHEPDISKEARLERVFSQFLAPRLLLTVKRKCSWQGRCELTEQTAQTIPVQSEAKAEGKEHRRAPDSGRKLHSGICEAAEMKAVLQEAQ